MPVATERENGVDLCCKTRRRIINGEDGYRLRGRETGPAVCRRAALNWFPIRLACAVSVADAAGAGWQMFLFPFFIFKAIALPGFHISIASFPNFSSGELRNFTWKPFVKPKRIWVCGFFPPSDENVKTFAESGRFLWVCIIVFHTHPYQPAFWGFSSSSGSSAFPIDPPQLQFWVVCTGDLLHALQPKRGFSLLCDLLYVL